MPALPVTLQIAEFPAEHQACIDSELERYSVADLERDPRLKPRVQAILTRSNYRVAATWLDELPALRVIATSGVGFDGIPVAQARAKNIAVAHTPGVVDGAVSEHALGLLLALTRKIVQADQFIRRGDWKDGVFPLGSSLTGKTVGIVGLGRIGQGIAQRLAGFGCDIAYCGSQAKPVPYRFIPGILDLASACDILIVSCPGGEKTRQLINAEVLQRLGSRGFIVNVARGTVIDEAALTDALQRGVIRGAGLDVFETEPLQNSPLATLDNVVLTPHLGSATEETRAVMLRLALDNIHNVLQHNAALTPVPEPVPEPVSVNT